MWKLPSVSFVKQKMTVPPPPRCPPRGAFVWAAPGVRGMSNEISVNDKIERIFGGRMWSPFTEDWPMNFDDSHLDGRARAQAVSDAERGERRVDEFFGLISAGLLIRSIRAGPPRI